MFQLSSVGKSYGAQHLFREVTWLIQPGDRVGLVGPNGCGKTTLLRMLTGAVRPDEGEVGSARGATVGYLAQEVERMEGRTAFEAAKSGASEIVRTESEIADLETRMAAAPGGSEASGEDSSRECVEALATRHGTLLERFVALDGYGVDARVRTILAGLGFSQEAMEQPLATLSGGWAMRAALARLLVAGPDLLLLDEPTNHLDLESIVWLEEFLASYPGAWVVVSHDRYFLERQVSKIAELTPEGLFLYEGKYESYLEQRAALLERLEKEAAGHAKRVADLQGFIDRFRAKATKARQAQSKVRLIEKLEEEMEERQAPLAAALSQQRRRPRLRLPPAPRSGEIAIELEGVRKAYGDNVVYAGLDMSVRRGERVALVGPNGSGKSTLLKMLAHAVSPDTGEIRLGHNVVPYYFAQHQTDALDCSATAIECLWEIMPTEGESRVRGVLGAFLFEGDDVYKTVGVLSGGEKARLSLARMLARPANLLLLDEPTNHLDLESREVLETALHEFNGSMVLISHDRWFINKMATRVVEIAPGGALTSFPGDYDYYCWKSDRIREEETASKEAPADDFREVDRHKEGKARGTKLREKKKAVEREARRREKETANLEDEIQSSETRLSEIDELLCEPDVYKDAARCKELLAEKEQLQARLEDAYERWAAL